MSSGHQHSPSPPTEGLSASPPRLHSSAGDIPRPKRIACVVCRKRKLRCDGSKPSCGTCSRLGHDCAYDEIRRKSGPKRGYVKALEARLAQVETLLKHQDGPSNANTEPHATDPSIFIVTNGKEAMRRAQERAERAQSQHHSESQNSIPVNYTNEANFPMDGLLDSQAGGELNIDNIALGWDMMSLGVEEALPAQDVQDALTALFFDKVYPTVPMIHKGRYLMSLGLPPSMKPPIALRYAIWTLAASVSDEYFSLQTHFYRMARKYAEDQELKGHGEHIISTSTSQTWTLIATYEFKLMYFPRAWLSTGRAVRLAQMMGLHRLDGVGLDVKQCLQPPKDWTEREERRRTFWLAFCVDRYASIGTGWPMTIEEKDIMTNLPASEDAFERGRPAKSLTLKEAMTADGAKYLSPFGGVVLMACLFGRNLIHLHRPDADDRDDDLSGEFWRRHRHMDNILLGIALSLPSHFKLPMGINDSNIVFTNMNIHTSTICLHQAAIFKAEKNNMPASVSTDSKVRCITAAAEIASIMRMIAHLDLSGMNPFLSFCLYVAARVFVQYLKSRPNDEQVRASLQFLLTAMGHIKKKNPLTESFLVQLDVDLAGMLVEGNEQPHAVSPSPDHNNGLFVCPMSEQSMRARLGQNVNPQISLFMETPQSDLSPSSSTEMLDSNGMTPSSSHTTNTSPHNTPLNQGMSNDPFSSQLEPPLPGMFGAYSNTGYTPLPVQDNPLSPSKDWMQNLQDEQDLTGIYSDLFNNNQYNWK